MNHLADEILAYQREVMNILLTFDALQSQLKLAHIQNCCFEDFEYIFNQALAKEKVTINIPALAFSDKSSLRLKIAAIIIAFQAMLRSVRGPFQINWCLRLKTSPH